MTSLCFLFLAFLAPSPSAEEGGEERDSAKEPEKLETGNRGESSLQLLIRQIRLNSSYLCVWQYGDEKIIFDGKTKTVVCLSPMYFGRIFTWSKGLKI